METGIAEMQRILAARELLARLGFQVDQFGPSTIAVYSLPQLLKTEQAEPAIREIAEAFDAKGSADSDEMLEKAVNSLACHGAIKAGQPLKQSEVDSLLEHRRLLDRPHRCAHGRPTSLVFALKEIEKQFLRR